jgi:hypothetical protein
MGVQLPVPVFPDPADSELGGSDEAAMSAKKALDSAFVEAAEEHRFAGHLFALD